MPDLDEWDGEAYDARLDMMKEGRRNQLRMETYYLNVFNNIDRELEKGQELLGAVLDLL